MRMPHSPAFTSQSEEMPQQSPYGYLNPQMPQLNAIYGYNPQYATLFQQQQSLLPQQKIQLWKLPTEVQPKQQLRQTQVIQQPKRPDLATQPTQHQPQLSKPIQQTLLKQPTYHQPINQPQKLPQAAQPPPSTATQKPQTFSPFGNVLNPYQQLWQIPQIYNARGFLLNPFQRNIPLGFGRPPGSNEEGTPYFGYYGFGARPPYNSEEDALENEDAAETTEPAKKEPKAESPAPDAGTNSTASTTNTTAASPPEANQGTNTTNSRNSPASNGVSPPKPSQGGSPSFTSPVNVSNHRDQGGNTLNSNGPNLPYNRGRPPLGDPHPRLPQVKQQIRGGPLGPRENSPGYGVHTQQGNARNIPLIIPETKLSAHTGNPSYSNMYSSGYHNSPINTANSSNRRGNSQGPSNYPDRTSGISQNPRYGPSGNDNYFQYSGKNPSVQRDMREFPTINPTGQRRISPPYREDMPDYRTNMPHTIGKYPTPDFRSFQQNENSFYPREDTDIFPVSGVQQSNQKFPKGIFLDQNRNPSHPDIDPIDQMKNVHNNWGQEGSSSPPRTGPSIYHENVPYPEVDPFIQRETMPSDRSGTWDNRGSIPVFEEAPPRQQNLSPYRGRNVYPDNYPYDDQGNSFQPRSSTWVNRENSYRGYTGQRGMPSEDNFYLENDPVDQRRHTPYADRSTWDYGTNFPGYEANQKTPSDQHETIYYPEGFAFSQGENPPYDGNTPWNQGSHSPMLNPTRHVGNSPYLSHDSQTSYPQNQPYDRMNTWRREEHFLNYGMGHPRQTDYVPYRSNAHRESIPYSSRNAWDIESNSPAHQRLLPPSERNSWDREVSFHNQDIAPAGQLENSQYFRSYPGGIRGNSPHREGRGWGYGGEETAIPESSPPDYRGIRAYPSINKLCCKDGPSPPPPRENVLALKDDSRREKRGSSFPDSSYSEPTQHANYSSENQDTPQNNSFTTGRNTSGPGESLQLKQSNSSSSSPHPVLGLDMNIAIPSRGDNNEDNKQNITQANPVHRQNKVTGSKRQRSGLSIARKNRAKRSLSTGMKSKTTDSDVARKQRLLNSIRWFYCFKNRLRLMSPSTRTPALATRASGDPPNPEKNTSPSHHPLGYTNDRKQQISKLSTY
ncbi:enamelin [Rhinatrema bivittatum]|uniref:enamelin n=1 Tax=Rhinatrema bivittatum TaxID=194408 RepID=UPI00112C7FEE|nr:enamelin [Rhinatrema bivittatum]